MARTTAQQLDAVDAAIAKIEASFQSLTKDDRTFMRGKLDTLYEERSKLTSKLSVDSAIRVVDISGT